MEEVNGVVVHSNPKMMYSIPKYDDPARKAVAPQKTSSLNFDNRIFVKDIHKKELLTERKKKNETQVMPK